MSTDRSWANEMLAQVRENHRRLDGCAFHEFHAEEASPRLGIKYRCARCQGQIDWIAYRWFLIGKRQEAAYAERQRAAG